MGNTTTQSGPIVQRHPLTGEPITPLWIRPDGRACWPLMGGSEDPAPPAGPADPPPADPTLRAPETDPDPAKGGKDAILADLAKERDKRQALEQQVQDLLPLRDQFAAIAKVFNPGGDTPPDPAALAQQVEAATGKVNEAETRAATAERKLAVVLAAADHEANVKALLDSSSFLDSIKEIDPADTAAISAAVKKAVDDHDHFKVATTPPFPGGPRKPGAKPDPGPGLPRLRDAYAQSSK